MKHLARFAIEVRETDFVLRLTDDSGEVVEFASSVEQLDQMIDVINDLVTEGDDDERVDA